MPTYQYRCTECGFDLEAVQKFSDDPLTECPQCGGPLRKVYNAVGVVFKGSGFYKTDNRASSKSSSSASSNASKPAEASSSSSSTTSTSSSTSKSSDAAK